MHNPRKPHWSAVKRVLCYLKGSIDYGLLYTPSSIALNAFCNSDWVGSPDDRKSTDGYGIFIRQNLVSWSSKKQSVVSESNIEAEYQSMTLATTELYWIRMLLRDLGVSLLLLCCGATILSNSSCLQSHFPYPYQACGSWLPFYSREGCE